MALKEAKRDGKRTATEKKGDNFRCDTLSLQVQIESGVHFARGEDKVHLLLGDEGKIFFAVTGVFLLFST